MYSICLIMHWGTEQQIVVFKSFGHTFDIALKISSPISIGGGTRGGTGGTCPHKICNLSTHMNLVSVSQ